MSVKSSTNDFYLSWSSINYKFTKYKKKLIYTKYNVSLSSSHWLCRQSDGPFRAEQNVRLTRSTQNINCEAHIFFPEHRSLRQDDAPCRGRCNNNNYEATHLDVCYRTGKWHFRELMKRKRKVSDNPR